MFENAVKDSLASRYSIRETTIDEVLAMNEDITKAHPIENLCRTKLESYEIAGQQARPS
jgi:hypothetical protein